MDSDENRPTSQESIGVFPSQNQLPDGILEEIDRNARAYGYEIGRGQQLGREITTSQDNPFLDPNWRDQVPEALPKA